MLLTRLCGMCVVEERLHAKGVRKVSERLRRQRCLRLYQLCTLNQIRPTLGQKLLLRNARSETLVRSLQDLLFLTLDCNFQLVFFRFQTANFLLNSPSKQHRFSPQSGGKPSQNQLPFQAAFRLRHLPIRRIFCSSAARPPFGLQRDRCLCQVVF